MEHHMHLEAFAFKKIKKGIKKYEVRLFDKKRRTIQKGHTIVFHNEDLGELKVVVVSLQRFSSVENVAHDISSHDLGFDSTQDFKDKILEIYPLAHINEHGIVVFHIKNQSL